VIDGCLTIDKPITIKAAAGLTHRVRSLGPPECSAIVLRGCGQEAEPGGEMLTRNGDGQDVLLWGVCPEIGVMDGEDKSLVLVPAEGTDRANPVKLERVSRQLLPPCGVSD
jgi:hypothetical protein